jgi:homoserine kinase
LIALALLGVLLSGCGPDLCKCLEEAAKENPDQTVMDKCREAFSKMEMDEVKAAVEKCGK